MGRTLDSDGVFERHAERPAEHVSRLEGGPYAHAGVATDLAMDDEAVVVTADLPGYDASDIEVDLVDRGLRIEAHPGDGTEGESRLEPKARFVRRERAAGPVVRTVELPGDVDPEGATARYDRGVLTVEIPRRSPPEGSSRAAERETHVVPIEDG